MILMQRSCVSIFLSTLSLRRATCPGKIWSTAFAISIHALLAESDRLAISAHRFDSGFLSTLSLRRATAFGGLQAALSGDFYPRSPCGERLVSIPRAKSARHFYPRSPCGERRFRFSVFDFLDLSFLSTLSLRRATGRHRSDNRCPVYFYPRSPCGERPIV